MKLDKRVTDLSRMKSEILSKTFNGYDMFLTKNEQMNYLVDIKREIYSNVWQLNLNKKNNKHWIIK